MKQLYQYVDKRAKVDLQAGTYLCRERNVNSKSYYAKVLCWYSMAIVKNISEKAMLVAVY